MKNSQPIAGKTAGRERSIALLGDELYFEIPTKIFKAISNLAKQYNYKLLYFAGKAYQSPFKFNSQSNILYNLINPQTVDGLITISNLLSSYTAPRAFRKRCLQFHPLPVVSLGLVIESIPSVVLDNTAGMYTAICHLIENHHFTRIAFLSGPEEHADVIERFTAFTRAMETHGLPVEQSLLLEGNYQRNSGIAAVGELLDIRGKKPGRDVQAIVCCNDYMASGVMLELQARGIRIPEEIALVGFDDIPFAECVAPSLSTICQPFDTMATRAMELLITLLEGKSVPEIVRVDARFIPRRSCGCPDLTGHNTNFLIPEEKVKMLQTDPHKFLEHLNRQIMISDKPILNVWKQALFYMREKGNEDWPSGDNDSSRDFAQTAWLLLGGTAYNTFYSSGYQNKIHNMGIALISTLDLDELLQILTEMLPGAGIGRCSICLYENPENTRGELPLYSRLILAFDRDGSEELPAGGLRFASAKLLPEEMVRKRGRKSWVTVALYFHWEQIGYALLDSDALYENSYLNLREQISGALKGAMLLKETRKAYSLLMEANEQKTQFFINVAHETKTPLTLIQNYLARYQEQKPPDENLLVIKQNIDLLLANMLNFLDVEKLQKGYMIYQHDTLVDLSESAHKKCELFQGVAMNKNIRITLNAEDNILIRIDPWALDRIFNNLLDNAVKYIPAGGRILLDIRREKGKAILRISDNGPGLPADTYAHIFEPYYLLSKKKTGKQGIGVGLSIIKNILDDLKADITVDKYKEGGACFTIAFNDSSAMRNREKLLKIPATKPTLLVKGSVKERNIRDGKDSLLVVDDDIQLLKFLQSAFDNSHNVYFARDVTEAIVKLKTIPRPDLIISDIMMDGPDGFELLTNLSSMDGYNDIPFIFLTAMGGEKEKIRGLGLGAVDYIEKPFSVAELTAKIDSIIALHRRQEKHEIAHIRKEIDGLLSGFDKSRIVSTKPGFDAFCEKFGIGGREPEIIRLLMGGLVNKEIAARQNISQRAVEYHITKIYKKCGVSNKFDLLNKFQG